MLVLVAIAALSGQGQPSGVDIVRNGKTDWIILMERPGKPMQRGAEEIQSAIQAMTGARLRVEAFGEGSHTMSRMIMIRDGVSGYGPEEYSIHVDDQLVLITGGGTRGALYGCYAFLEDVLGCRWYTRTISKYPRKANIHVPRMQVRERPAFEYREPYFTEAMERNWAVRNRLNGSSMDLDDSVGGKVTYGRFVHTFSELVPPKDYFATHPEYFSLVKGKRQDGYAQLCLTNPDVLKIVVAKVKSWIKENPSATIFSVSQNDTNLNCECDNCKAVEKEEGAPSGVVLRFVNKVADDVGTEYPNVLIDTLAYQWSEKPPLHERPHKNVRIRLAPIGACVAHPLDGCQVNKAPYQNLLDWSKIANQLYIWHYCTNFSNYLQPLPDLDEIAGDVKLFRRHGVVGLFYEGSYEAGGGGDMAELKSYVMAKLMWNPNRPVKPIVADYLQGVYGSAAPYLQRWLDLLHRPARERGVHAFIYDDPTAQFLTEDLLVQGQTIFDQAARAVSANEVQSEQVRKARLWLDYVRLLRAGKRFDKSTGKFVDVPAPDREKLARHVLGEIRHFGITSVREGEPISAFITRLGLPPDSGGN